MRRLAFPLQGRLPSLSVVLADGQFRYVLEWYRSRRENYLLDHAIPWLTYDAVNFLRTRLRENMVVFEYGSGASTMFWLSYHDHCVSVEHDADWYQVVKARLKAADDVDLRLVGPDATPQPGEPDMSDPQGYWTDWQAFSRDTWKNYASQIDSFSDQHFDIVLVDGQARPGCIAHSLRKVKPGGMLILDNANVPAFQPAITAYLGGLERHSFRGLAPIDGAMSQTDVFIVGH